MFRVLVTGSTGNIGRELTAQLIARGVSVQAMTRDPKRARTPPGAEIVCGDFTRPETIEACARAVDSMFLVWQGPDHTVDEVVDRIARHVKRVVFISNQTVRDDREEQDFSISTLHARVERAIASSGVEWTFLRPGAFASNARLWWARQIHEGDVVRWPCARAHSAPIHEVDIAAVAVRALLEAHHGGAKYILTGPRSLTLLEQAQILGEALGRRLRFEEMPPETALTELSAILSEPIATMLLAAWQQRLDKPEIVTSTVADLTGTEPRSFHQWSLDHASDFRAPAPQGC